MSLRLEIPSPNDTLTETMPETDQFSSKSEDNRRFRQNFEDAMPSSRKPKQYESAGVLMLSFDHKCTVKGMKNMDVSEEVKQLGEVFCDDYNFEVTTKVIKSNSDAQSQAYKHLSDFRLKQSQKKHSLTILYYAGHGWRSLSKARKKKGGFDLTPSRVIAEVELAEGTFIMWEAAEKLLHGMQNDVLVIFDCCDSGYLDGRGSVHTFDYLVACAENKKTHLPGPNSFTNALIWALKELKPDVESDISAGSKRNKPFKIQQLRDKIKEHVSFPPDQEPRVFPRLGNVTEPIWLAPIKRMTAQSSPEVTPNDRRRSSSTKPDNRPEERSYVDLRFFFKEHITVGHVEKIVRMVEPTVQNQNFDLNANHVSALEFGSTVAPRTRFKRVFNSIRAANSFSKVSPQADEEEEPEEFDSLVRKRAKIGQPRKEQKDLHDPISPLSVLKRPVTPVSDATQSDADTHVTVRVESGAAASVDVHLTASSSALSNNSDAVGIRINPSMK